jgi:hypothetical protein
MGFPQTWEIFNIPILEWRAYSWSAFNSIGMLYKNRFCLFFENILPSLQNQETKLPNF